MILAFQLLAMSLIFATVTPFIWRRVENEFLRDLGGELSRYELRAALVAHCRDYLPEELVIWYVRRALRAHQEGREPRHPLRILVPLPMILLGVLALQPVLVLAGIAMMLGRSMRTERKNVEPSRSINNEIAAESLRHISPDRLIRGTKIEKKTNPFDIDCYKQNEPSEPKSEDKITTTACPKTGHLVVQRLGQAIRLSQSHLLTTDELRQAIEKMGRMMRSTNPYRPGEIYPLQTVREPLALMTDDGFAFTSDLTREQMFALINQGVIEEPASDIHIR